MNQTSQGIPIHIAHAFSGFQLLELPPELLSLVENGSATKLYLKSENDSSSDSAPSQADNLAMVCSDDATFSVRQAQSSNSIYILQSCSSRGSGNSSPTSHLTAVSLCKAALELVPTRPQALAHLAKRIPVLPGPDADARAAAAAHAGAARPSKAALQADAPFSTVEFDAAWRALCAFESEEMAWQPANEVKVGVWTALASAAAVSGVKLTEAFDPTALQDLVQEDGYSSELLLAVLRNLAADASPETQIQLDRARCTAWLGGCALVEAGAKGISETKLQERWQELLPDAWEDDARLEHIAGQYKLVDSLLFPTDGMSADQGAATKNTEPARPKNKWHSRFAA